MHRIISANFDHIAEPKLDQVVFNVNTFPGPDGQFGLLYPKTYLPKKRLQVHHHGNNIHPCGKL